MELTLKELKRRDVINVVDGSCLGRIDDMKFTFPKGAIAGIFVPGKKTNFFLRLFIRSRLYIEESNIVKIGGDVILVSVKCGETCESNVNLNSPTKGNKNPCLPCGTNYNGYGEDGRDE